MAQTFTAIPTRVNGHPQIDANWFNLLRLAGVALEALVGSGYVGATDFTIVNNQSSAANVTGLLFSGATYRTVFVDYQVYRNTTGGGATERVQSGTLVMNYKTVAATWELSSGPVVGDAGVEFTVTSAGQVQYTSDNQTGSAATSKMTFTARTIGV